MVFCCGSSSKLIILLIYHEEHFIHTKNNREILIYNNEKEDYLGISLRRHAQNLCKENYKTLLKDKEVDWKNGKDIPSFWVGNSTT